MNPTKTCAFGGNPVGIFVSNPQDHCVIPMVDASPVKQRFTRNCWCFNIHFRWLNHHFRWSDPKFRWLNQLNPHFRWSNPHFSVVFYLNGQGIPAQTKQLLWTVCDTWVSNLKRFSPTSASAATRFIALPTVLHHIYIYIYTYIYVYIGM